MRDPPRFQPHPIHSEGFPPKSRPCLEGFRLPPDPRGCQPHPIHSGGSPPKSRPCLEESRPPLNISDLYRSHRGP